MVKKVVKVDKVKDSAKSVFQEWWEYSTQRESDRFSRKLYKFFVRTLGIVLIIVFSPMIAVVLLFALMAAF